jgi:hypothetical protein
MANNKKIRLLNHLRWFYNNRENIYTFRCSKRMVAVAFFPLNEKSWSIYRSENLYKYFDGNFSESVDFLLRKLDKNIHAKIKNNNLRSIIFHKKIGFKKNKNDEFYSYFTRQKK